MSAFDSSSSGDCAHLDIKRMVQLDEDDPIVSIDCVECLLGRDPEECNENCSDYIPIDEDLHIPKRKDSL